MLKLKRLIHDMLGRLIDDVARFPDRASFVWSGRYSIIACVVFHAFTAFRFLSLLQWIKYFVRRSWRQEGRRDFHAQYTEIYFLGLFAVAIAIWFARDQASQAGYFQNLLADLPPVARAWWPSGLTVFVWCLIFETTTWLFYYLVVRSFTERDYVLFDAAEYFILFPLIILLQATLFGLELRLSPVETLLYQLGASSRQLDGLDAVLLRILGVSYVAITIAILVNNHPGLFVRKKWPTRVLESRRGLEVAIIGAGDVVRNRQVRGLIKAGVNPSSISVYDLAPPVGPARDWLAGAPEDSRQVNFAAKSTPAIATECLLQGRPTFISSSSDAHMIYLREFAQAGLPFAVEKPLTSRVGELRELRANQTLMRHGFALSYYALEKALPLTLLLDPHPAYLPLCEVIELVRPAEGSWTDPQVRASRLGALTHVHLCLHEREESRSWPYDLERGGIYFETLVHMLVLWAKTSVLEGKPGNPVGSLVSRSEWTTGLLGNQPHVPYVAALGPSYVHWELERIAPDGARKTRASLSCGKNFDHHHRRGTIWFERGCIVADFDEKSATLYEGSSRVLRIGLKEKFKTNYHPQTELFLAFLESGGEWQSNQRFDDFDHQLAVLEFLHQNVPPLPSPTGSFLKGQVPPAMASLIATAESNSGAVPGPA